MRISKFNPQSREKWILSFLYLGGKGRDGDEAVMGRTRLMKELFLVDRKAEEKGIKTDMNFEPYRFGASDNHILICLQDLIDGGYIRVVPKAGITEFSLTNAGLRKAQEYVKGLRPEEQGIIRRVKRNFNYMPQKDLLKYVYQEYPAYTKKSKIMPQVFREDYPLLSKQIEIEYDKSNLMEEISIVIDMAVPNREALFKDIHIYSMMVLSPPNIYNRLDVSDLKQYLTESEISQIKSGYLHHEVIYKKPFGVVLRILDRLLEVSNVVEISIRPSAGEYLQHKRIRIVRGGGESEQKTLEIPYPNT